MLPLINQTWIVLGAVTGLLGHQIFFVFPYCLLPALRAPDSIIRTDLDTESWLASSSSFTYIIGVGLSSILMENYGRRLTFILMMLPCLLGWIIIYFSTSVTSLIVGNLIGGVSLSSSLVVGATVMGEYSSPLYRGLFLSMRAPTQSIGNIMIHVLSNYFDWRTVALIGVVPVLIAICIACTWPESPMWLASKSKFDQSEKVFYWLRGLSEESSREFKALIQAQKIRIMNTPRISVFKKFLNVCRNFRKKEFCKPVFIGGCAFFLMDAVGRQSFPVYAADIIGGITDVKSYSFLLTISIDVLTIVSAMTGCILVKSLKRRTLLFTSGGAGLAFLVPTCVYLLLVDMEVLSSGRSWIPLTLLVLYYTSVNVGCTIVPSTLFGEIFPITYKSSAIATVTLIRSFMLIIILKYTSIMIVNIKVYGTFGVYGLIMSITLLCLYVTLPETKNKTLQEIEEFFRNSRTDQLKQNDEVEERLDILRENTIND